MKTLEALLTTVSQQTLKIDTPDPRPELVPGALVGRYRIDHQLGIGGTAVVYAAFDRELERHVALKVAADPRLGAGVRREARLLARLDHPNVVRVYDSGLEAGRDFVVMELVDGTTLARWMRAAHRGRQAILDAFVSAGRGLQAAHAAGIVHRDFKPDNILRRHDGHTVLADFGIASGAGVPEVLVPSTKCARAARSELVFGTPAYMAPEQWLGEGVGPAADQYAFSVALGEALAGVRPRGSVDDLREATLRGHRHLDVPDLPGEVRHVLRRAMDPDPERRWPSMRALLAELGRSSSRAPRLARGSSPCTANLEVR